MSTSTTEPKVRDILLAPDKIPVMAPSTILKEALEMMSRARLGVACITDEDGKLIGLFTDGDLRRLLLRAQKPLSALFADDIIVHARSEFTSIGPDTAISQALALFEQREIWDLPVLDEAGRLVGLIHLHPALRALLER